MVSVVSDFEEKDSTFLTLEWRVPGSKLLVFEWS